MAEDDSARARAEAEAGGDGGAPGQERCILGEESSDVHKWSAGQGHG